MKSTLGVVGMLKYLSKFAMDILPSVAATIIGAYIVNHYIVAKPGADAPVAAAVSSANPKSDAVKSDAVANLPGVRAKGISEKAVFDKSGFDQPTEKAASEKPASEKAVAEKPSTTEKSGDDKPVETASLPADSRKRATPVRDKTAIRTIPLTASSASPAQPATPVVAPSAVPVVVPTVEAAVTPEDHRDANDLARAAIERLRGSNETSPVRTPEAARAPDAPRVVSVPASSPQISAPQVAVRPLPPPIMVSTPSSERYGADPTGSLPMQQSYPASARIDDPRRPTPPADIPTAPPLDLQANAGAPPAQDHRNVAQDMLSAAKSVFHAVLPQ
jgi:hypothetical protein